LRKKHGEYLRDKRNRRKEELVKLKGGKCQRCGYSKSLSALGFHHKKGKVKKFNISGKNLSHKTWKELVEESEKCELLCSNCHAEVHDEEGWIHEDGKQTPKMIRTI